MKDELTKAAMAARAPLEVAEARLPRSAPLEHKMRKMAVETPTGCLEWQGAVNKLGYGLVWFQGPKGRTSTTAHRKFYEATRGAIPLGVQVNHKCDNRRCINPDHMFLGSQIDNIQDMMRKGRDNFRGKGPYLKRISGE